ncbi:hypothetical protein DdX_07857 [Ditylenchus destructor]|uniref:Uncharacterized protein n=1 Tax=Ditylenchus destructor TaxID=166010 RepID=A0AAD4R7W9_9BILA|nr:hypothetical protein DdX_07857 [Ditylenchus destructor]
MEAKTLGYKSDCPRGFAAWRRPWSSRIFRISGSHKSRYSQKLTARPVPIVLSHRDEANDVSHARIRAPIGKLPFYVTHGCHVFTCVFCSDGLEIIITNVKS